MLFSSVGRQFRSILWKCSMKKGVSKNFAKFTGKYLCRSVSFNEFAGGACNFIKKENPTQVFSCEFCKVFKNSYFVEYLQTAASDSFSTIKYNLHVANWQWKCHWWKKYDTDPNRNFSRAIDDEVFKEILNRLN